MVVWGGQPVGVVILGCIVVVGISVTWFDGWICYLLLDLLF